jgi:LytS/YehU family sensor histidine kinase
MEIRFRGRFDTRVEVEPDVRQALVPQLVLQPLVENAMKHGIGHASGNGYVQVSASRQDGELVLRVRDSGSGSRVDAGLPEPAARAGDADLHGGFGLRHTRERLSQLYGDQGRLVLQRGDDGGTVAEVRLPYHVPYPDDAPPASSHVERAAEPASVTSAGAPGA